MSEVTSELKSVDIRLYYIVFIAVSYLLVGAINLVFLYVESMLLQNAGQRIVYRLRNEVFTHIENMSLGLDIRIMFHTLGVIFNGKGQ